MRTCLNELYLTILSLFQYQLKTEKKSAPEPVKEAPVVVTSVKAAGTVEKESQSDAGPRQAGARRSAERARGTRANADKSE